MTYTPGSGFEILLCPYDQTPTTPVGSSDFPYRCRNCGRVFRLDGTEPIFPGRIEVLSAPPGVVPPNLVVRGPSNTLE